jgi:hypothetical protein
VKTITYVDPPSGWKFGFPKILPEGVDYREFLIANGYPERDLELALSYSRYWTKEETDE